MKKISMFLTMCLMILSLSVFAQINVISNGNVGIKNSSPTYELDVKGYVRFTSATFSGIDNGFLFSSYYLDNILDPLTDSRGILGYYHKWSRAYINNIWTAVPVTVSDEKLKENVKSLSNALETVTKLRGVKYDLKPDFFGTMAADGKEKSGIGSLLKNRIGFIAQEMAMVLPELVVYDSVKQVQGIVYENLIPVLVEAIKEQQTQIEELKNKVTSIEANCCTNNLKSASLTIGTTSNLAENAAQLDQNIPNPFSKETKIGCFIPEASGTSVLYIYNMNGTQLQQYNVNGKGKQSVTINGNSFVPGMYLYALVIDGKEVDTKRMILTK